MLSKEEKDEMLRDGASQKRRQDFRASSFRSSDPSLRSLDKFLDYLRSVQMVFPFRDPSRKRIATDKNIL